MLPFQVSYSETSTYGHYNTPENMLPMYDQSTGQMWDPPMMPEWPPFILQPQRLEQADRHVLHANANGHAKDPCHATFRDMFSIENDHDTHQFAVNSANQQHMAHEALKTYLLRVHFLMLIFRTWKL